MATEIKELKETFTEIDKQEDEFDMLRPKLPPDESKEPSVKDDKKKPKDKKKHDLPKFEDDGWKGENTGRAHDVSDFGPEKKPKPKEEVKVGKLNAEDNAFLKNNKKDEDKPKRKAGKKVIRDSPFKKSTTSNEKAVESPGKSSGFKRQLSTGTRG